MANLKETDLKEIIAGCRNPRPYIETHLPARDTTPGRSSPPLVAAAPRREELSPARLPAGRRVTPTSSPHSLPRRPLPAGCSGVRWVRPGSAGLEEPALLRPRRAPRLPGARVRCEAPPPRGRTPSARPVPPYPRPNPGGPSRGAPSSVSASANSGRPPARPTRTPPGTRRPGPSGAAPRRALASFPAPGPGLPDGAGGSSGQSRSRLGPTAVTQPAEAGGEEGAVVPVSLPPPSRLGTGWAAGPRPSVGPWSCADAVRNAQMGVWDGIGCGEGLGTASCAWGSVVPEPRYSACPVPSSRSWIVQTLGLMFLYVEKVTWFASLLTVTS